MTAAQNNTTMATKTAQQPLTGKVKGTRRGSAFVVADRHSKHVRIMKIGLPLAALFGVGFFSAATVFSRSSTPIVTSSPVVMNDGRIVMANPKLEGFTSDNRPYKMVAERAIQQSATSPLVELEKISAEFPFGKDAVAKLEADTGTFDNAAKMLNLSDDIMLVSSDGMRAKLSSASINTGTSDLVTDKPVDIVTQGSHITADRMSTAQGGKIIIFENHVRLNIDAKQLKQSGSQSGESGQ